MSRKAAEAGGLETALYLPVKRFLEVAGFSVKGEIGGCDVVGLRDDDRILVVCEMKLRFNLELLLQGVDRAGAADEVWLAIRTGAGKRGREADSRVRQLCRLLGFGLLGVAPGGRVDILVAAGPWQPRRDPKRRSRLVDEHRRRQGDPASGGSSRAPIMTAYRQQALACAAALAHAPGRPRDLANKIPDAAKILRGNVYGWFMRIERGIYALTDQGRAALVRWPGSAPAQP